MGELYAQHYRYIGDLPEGDPCPIQSFIRSSGRKESTLRRVPFRTTHLRRKEGSMRLIPALILRLEPRALSSGNGLHTGHELRYTGQHGGRVVYPGWYGRRGI